MDESVVTVYRTWLAGASCTSVETTNGIPFVRFGSFGLWIPSPWRITREGHIVTSSESDDQSLAEELPALLPGRVIEKIEICGPFHDLDIHFEAGLRLETFSDSEKHENWNPVGGPDRMVIAGPGMTWSAWIPST